MCIYIYTCVLLLLGVVVLCYMVFVMKTMFFIVVVVYLNLLYIFAYCDNDYMYVHLIYCNSTDHHHHEASHVRTMAIVTSIIVGTSGMVDCFSTVAKTIVIKHE